MERRAPLENLYGRLSIPETFRVLGSGETARLKLREALLFSTAPASEPSGRSLRLPQDFTVTATYDLDDTSLGNPYAPIKSDNGLVLTVGNAPKPRN